MEIAFLVIAIVGLLALSSGGVVSGNLSVAPNSQATLTPPGVPAPVYTPITAPPPAPTAYTPTPASTFNPPMVPSTGANTTGALFAGTAAIGTAALPSAASAGLISTAAIPVVGAAIAAFAAVAIALLAAHQKRLTDAKNENAAVDQWIPVFDSFVASVVQAYNSGQTDATNAASICQQFDQTLYNKFRSFVGQPGTAWNDSIGMSGKCNSSCTVGCCVYFGDLGPVLNNISYVLGFPTGKWGQGDPRINGRTITVPEVYPSKYSSLTRPSYTITLN